MDGAPTVAQDAAKARQCAMRDIEVVTLIEDHGEANDIAPEQLAKAALTHGGWDGALQRYLPRPRPHAIPAVIALRALCRELVAMLQASLTASMRTVRRHLARCGLAAVE